MCAAADGHILDRPDWLFIGINNFEALYIPLLQFPTHNPRQRTYLGIIDIRDLQPPGIQLVPGSHGADNRNIFFLCPENQLDLGCHSINGIHDIVIFPKWKLICILGQKKTLMDCDIRI